jgi:uncharacterized protein YodC (DUF2158 family)
VASEETAKLVEGAVVEVKSGGLAMTIAKIDSMKVCTVFWFDDDAMLRTTEIPLVALHKTDERWGDDDEDDELDDDDDEEDDELGSFD